MSHLRRGTHRQPIYMSSGCRTSTSRGSTFAGIRSIGKIGFGADSENTAQHVNGGYGFFENPNIDSRSATPIWFHTPPDIAELALEGISVKSSTFSLWRLPGRQALLHDGRSIHIRVETGCRPIELTIPAALGEGAPFSFRVAPGAFQRINWLAAMRANEILTGSRLSAVEGRAFRPSRTAVTHMRMIQALDGRMAGASHRDIAAAVFGGHLVRRSWSADGELRAQIRYLVRRSSELASGGYWNLAGLGDYSPGDFRTTADSP